MSYTPLYGNEDTNNSTTTPLASAATYTGAWVQDNRPEVIISLITDNTGTLYFDFSTDGVNNDSSLSYTIAAGTHEFHRAVKGPRYFRVRLVNDAGAQTYLRLSTYFGWFGLSSAPMNLSIADDADAIVAKSVISGVGNTTATVTNHKALQVVPPAEGKTGYGDTAVVESRPVLQLTFPYTNVNTQLIDSRANQSGTVTISGGVLLAQSGAAANSSGVAYSKELIQKRAGNSFDIRFDGYFTTGVANSEQMIGRIDRANGYAFGYNGPAFGILHRKDGSYEIRTLTITTASSTAENVTVTLDGDADATVAVTASGVITTTVNEIAAHDYSSVGKGWHAYAVGDTVVFVSWSCETQTGTYSIAGTSVVGTFAQTVAGVAPTDTWIAQASWNGSDIFDGAGLTGVTLDPTKGNTYQIKYQDGYGGVQFFISDPPDQEFHLVHTISTGNTTTTPNVDSLNGPLGVISSNDANTSNLTVGCDEISAFNDGQVQLNGPRFSAYSYVSSVTTTLLPILTIKNMSDFQSMNNRSMIKLVRTNLAVDHTKPMIIRFYKNATLTGAVFAAIDTDSMVYLDTTATAMTGGTEILSPVPLGQTGAAPVDVVSSLDGLLAPGEALTVGAVALSGTGGDATAAIEWVELI